MQFPLANTKGIFSNIYSIQFLRQILNGFEASILSNLFFIADHNCHYCLGPIIAMTL